jgi:hypothetical protein
MELRLIKKIKQLFILHLVLLLSACATLYQQPSNRYPDKESQRCATFFNKLEHSVSKAGVTDSQAARIKSFPYLRVNRFLSDFRHDDLDKASFNTWLDKMQQLANEGWKIELSNLPIKEQKALSLDATTNLDLNKTIQTCGFQLREIDFDTEQERQYFKTIAKVPDEYKIWKRALGLYPLTALVFRSGIDAWHEETRKVYAQAINKLKVHGKLLRYSLSRNIKSLPPKEVSEIIKASSNNKLNIPQLSISDKQKLFDNFTPIFEIDTVTNDDRIGAAKLDKNKLPMIDTNSAKTYQHLSYTRIDDKILLQLNYSIWFPARPKTSTLDMLGGHLDGITWRVTLLPNGKPLLFDSIHNCGCYHLFFPTQHAAVLPQPSTIDEPVFIPQSLSINSNDKKPVIRIAYGNHYIERVYFDGDATDNAIAYELTDYNELRSLEAGNDVRQSLFDENGIIQSSKRGERFLFWPMGIPNPGAMRQWGHHATAFVGRRHFDDARLFQHHFTTR